MDVDCSKFTYDTLPSATIQAAVEKAQREMDNMPLIGEGVMLNRTETQEEVLSKSLLKHIDEKEASEDDILEAYCRDVDAYSFEFNQPETQQQNRVVSVAPQRPQVRKEILLCNNKIWSKRSWPFLTHIFFLFSLFLLSVHCFSPTLGETRKLTQLEGICLLRENYLC